MNVLLDTNALLWWLEDDARIARQLSVISDPRNVVFLSAVSVAEISDHIFAEYGVQML